MSFLGKSESGSGKVKAAVIGALLASMSPSAAIAQLVLSDVVVDFVPGKPPRADIEAWNNSKERMYIVAEASEIVSPGLPDEQRTQNSDPEKLGLLATPARMVLEPGQHKLIRLASIGERRSSDRIYRVAIKPVAGDVVAEKSALKIMVGYDVLVIVRPDAIKPQVEAVKTGKKITFRNTGNTNVELVDGRQCDAGGKVCRELPSKRLYPGASWEQLLTLDSPVEYSLKSGGQVTAKRF